MNVTRQQILGGLCILGSLFWLSLGNILAPDWGPPGSRYLSYDARLVLARGLAAARSRAGR